MSSTSRHPFSDHIARYGVAILDGGLATELEAQGNDLSDDLWSARLLRDDPAAIQRAHEAYFRAGADPGALHATCPKRNLRIFPTGLAMSTLPTLK